MEGQMSRRKRVAAALLSACAFAAALAPTAGADQPNFNPGQKGNVCSAPGPNSNPHCHPG
jgi:hypothetical protein